MAGFDAIDTVMQYVLGTILLGGLLFLLRRVLLWYWKLDRIEKHLAEIAAALKGSAATSSPRAPAKSG